MIGAARRSMLRLGPPRMRGGLPKNIIITVDESALKFLRGLRAVREFTPEPVDDASLQQILEVGRWTSTGGNRQGTEVVVVRDKDVLQKFAEWGAKPGGASTLSLLLVTGSDMGVLDEGRYAERLALAARACGLGSVIATLKNEGPSDAKKLLGIPEDKRAVVIVAIGHTDREARKGLPKQGAAARKPMEQFAHQGRW